MSRIAYGTVTNSWDRVAANITPRIGDRPLMALWGQTSITAAYNTIVDAYAGHGLDMLVLLHDDLEIVDPDAEAKFLHALAEPDVALVGVAGGRGVTSLAWWNADAVGHQRIDTGLLDFGTRTGDVDSIEGSVMALSPWAIEHLRWDETFTGWHCCDEAAMTARRAEKRVVVADVDTHHHTVAGFKSAAAEREWFDNDARYRAKWDL